MTDEPVVRVRDVVKRFRRADGSVVHAVDHVSFDVTPGQMVVLVGPSGCGKTTLLRSIAGLERPDEGLIEIHGEPYFSSRDRVDVPPERRRVSMVFQNYALWPHMTAFQNVAYPLRSDRRRRLGRREVAERAHHILGLVGIPDLAGQHPHQMSGGQRQRVALARALVAGADVVLFDEPLSNVDAKVRTRLRLELLAMQRELKFSAIFVTHDQVEAMELAHVLAVMGAGRVAQFGSPREVYERPRSRYVAGFIGTTNELVGTISSRDGDEVRVTTPLGEIVGRAGTDAGDRAPTAGPGGTDDDAGGTAPTAAAGGIDDDAEGAAGAAGDAVAGGREVVAVWRPERTVLGADRPGGPNCWEATVRTSMFLGSHTECAVEVGGLMFRVWQPGPTAEDEGARLWMSVDPAHVRVLPADIGDGDGDGRPAP